MSFKKYLLTKVKSNYSINIIHSWKFLHVYSSDVSVLGIMHLISQNIFKFVSRYMFVNLNKLYIHTTKLGEYIL